MASGYRCLGECEQPLTPTCDVDEDGETICPNCGGLVENVTLDYGSVRHDPDERFETYQAFRRFFRERV